MTNDERWQLISKYLVVRSQWTESGLRWWIDIRPEASYLLAQTAKDDSSAPQTVADALDLIHK